AIDCGVSSDESDSKNTRSPTLTTKSCALPGAALPAPRPAFAPFIAFGLLAHAARDRPAAIIAANVAPRMKRVRFVIFPCLLLPHDRTCIRSNGRSLSERSVNLDERLPRPR